MGLSVPEGFTSFEKGPTAKPGGIVLYDVGGNAYLLWVDTTGDLRIAPFTGVEPDWASGGTIVGTQM